MGWTRGKRNSVMWSQRNFVCVFSAALAAPLSMWTVAFLFWGDEDVAPTAVAEPALVLVSWRPGVFATAYQCSCIGGWLVAPCTRAVQPLAKESGLDGRLRRTPGRQDTKTKSGRWLVAPCTRAVQPLTKASGLDGRLRRTPRRQDTRTTSGRVVGRSLSSGWAAGDE